MSTTDETNIGLETFDVTLDCDPELEPASIPSSFDWPAGGPNPKHRVPWLVVFAAVAMCLYLLLSTGLGAYQHWLELNPTQPVAAGLYVVAVAAACISVILLLVVVIKRFRGLPIVSELQQMCRVVKAEKRVDDHVFRDRVRGYLFTLRDRCADDKTRGSIAYAMKKFEQYSNGAKHDLEVLTDVCSPLHELANRRIESAACQTALGTALATRHLDLLIITAQAIRLTDQVASIYVGKPSRIQVVRLAGRALSHLLVANIAGLFIEAAAAVIPMKVMSVLGPRIGEGMVNGALMLRFGEAVQTACCPVPPPHRSVVDYLQTVRRLVLSEQSPAAED